MIIIGLVGGIGNQLFGYSLYEALKHRGKEVYFDLSFYNEGDYRKHRIDNFINLDLPEVDKKTVIEYRDGSRNIFSRFRRKILGISKAKVYVDKEERFQPEVFEMDDIYLQGYWQSELYFKNIEDKIRNTFTFRDLMNSYQKEMLTEIESNNSVSIHIRRGEYLQFAEIYGGICTDKYYENAVKKFDKIDCKFYVFSNDYKYAKTHYSGDRFVVVKPFEQFPAANMDLLLMSRCKHNIIANSTFSWWAAWLNNKENKMVISPNKWINKPVNDIYCSNWIKVESY